METGKPSKRVIPGPHDSRPDGADSHDWAELEARAEARAGLMAAIVEYGGIYALAEGGAISTSCFAKREPAAAGEVRAQAESAGAALGLDPGEAVRDSLLALEETLGESRDGRSRSRDPLHPIAEGRLLQYAREWST